MTLRTVTSTLLGALRGDARSRADFLALAGAAQLTTVQRVPTDHVDSGPPAT